MPDPVVLNEIHHRQVDLRFYGRSDGLYEVVGHLTDTKSHAFMRQLSKTALPAGTPLHDISVHLVIDSDMLIMDAFARMDATPFPICPGAAEAVRSLKGLKIGSGWNRKVRELLGGARSCTHIVELLGPMATTAFQGLAPQRLAALNSAEGQEQRESKINSCYSYSSEREVVQNLWPDLHKSPPQHGS